MDWIKDRNGWSGPGRTEARWLRDTLDMPYSKSRRIEADGTVVHARNRNGFLETWREPQALDLFVMATREDWQKDIIRASTAMSTQRDAENQVIYWGAPLEITHPLASDWVTRRMREGLMSAGGNARVFMVIPTAKDSVFDRWGESAGADPVSTVRRRWTILMGTPGAMQAAGEIDVVSFSDGGSSLPGMVRGYVQSMLPFVIDGNEVPAEVPGVLWPVAGAMYAGNYESALAYETLNDDGDHVVRVRVFGYVTNFERTIAEAERNSFRLRGFWRAGPGAYLACISHVYPDLYGREHPIDASVHGVTLRNHEPLGANEPMTFFMSSTDGGRTWQRLPENTLLAPANELARQLATDTLPGTGVWSPDNDLVFVNDAAIGHTQAVPVAPGKMLVTVVRPWRFIHTFGTPTYLARDEFVSGILDITTGTVTDLNTVFRPDEYQGSLTTQAGQDWLDTEAGRMSGGLFLDPVGVGMVAPHPGPMRLHNWLMEPSSILLSADGGASWTAGGYLPAEWLVCGLPQAVNPTMLSVVRMNTVPPITVYLRESPALDWTPTASGIGDWWILTTSTTPLFSNVGRFITSNSRQGDFHRIVRPSRNPTPTAPWVSDDRIEP